MSDSKLRIPLEKNFDANGNPYYIGKLKSPILIDCREGTAFMIFISISDDEEMQICSMHPPKENKQKFNFNKVEKYEK